MCISLSPIYYDAQDNFLGQHSHWNVCFGSSKKREKRNQLPKARIA